MQTTNKKNLNEAIVRAVQRDWYSGAGEERDYSVTQLLNPVKIVHLMKRHKSEIQEDVSDKLWLLMGSAMHAILERANENEVEFQILSRTRNFFNYIHENPNMNDEEIMKSFSEMVFGGGKTKHITDLTREMTNDRYLVEKRFSYVTKSGKLITGGIDLFDKKESILHDYKFTSIWTWIYRNREGSHIEKYTEQLNIYRLFMEAAGYEVNKLRINLIFRDYSKTDASRERNYPNPVEVLEIPLLGLDFVEQLVENKIAEIEKYANTFDDGIPVCTPSERWQGHDTYAVMKQGNIKASKVEYSYAAARSWIDAEAQKIAEKEVAKGKDPYTSHQKALGLFSIAKRPAKSTRCLDYCAVNKFCNFYKSLPSELK